MHDRAEGKSRNRSPVPGVSRRGADKCPAVPARNGTQPYRKHHRAIFLSDMHLGARMCQPKAVLEFLERNTADTIYLVGDIVDNWDPLSPNWSEDHHRVLRKLLHYPKAGINVVYIPGNHDAFFRHLAGTDFGGIAIRRQVTHVGLDGRRYLVVHGDCCDIFSIKAPLLGRLGSILEGIARGMDMLLRRATRAAGKGEWTGIEDAILWTNAVIRKFDRFEERLSELAITSGADGVICGHFHEPALRDDFGPIYANCGDWSSNCTAIVEGQDGRLRLMTADETVADFIMGRSESVAAAESENALAI